MSDDVREGWEFVWPVEYQFVAGSANVYVHPVGDGWEVVLLDEDGEFVDSRVEDTFLAAQLEGERVASEGRW